jgi:pimeloyl-ACP methyl ester carboxylesterase
VSWEEYYVPLEEFGASIYTQKISSKNKQGKGIMVALHGFGGGSGVWTKSLNQLATQCETLYVLDMIGFARSTKCTTVSDNVEPEAWFVDSLEAWRKTMQIEKLTILGHSFGGFISSLYTLKYPKHVEKLVLVSPIGIAPAFDRLRSKSVAIEKLWIKAGEMFYNLRITLNLILRATGPFSKYLVRIHALWRFHNGVPLAEYTWRTNTLAPTLASQKTEKGIWQLLLPGAFAKKSLVEVW